MSSALVPTRYLTLEGFARATDLHPDLVRRLVALGLFDVQVGPAGEHRFHESQLAVAARIERLRCWLGLSYSSIGVVVDLLDRIERLEAALRELEARPGARTRTARTRIARTGTARTGTARTGTARTESGGVTWIRRV
jgi:hypothetical protein